MEDNSKGLISTGSVGMTKTEKLLSITKKILNEIKPTTQYESVNIGSQEWMVKNLDVDRFRNGDLIPYIESDEEWVKARENCQPAWCYYDNEPENGEIYGKLYNWFAVNDTRGLAPEGWHVPTNDEFTTLTDFLGGENIAGDKMKTVEGWDDYVDEEGEIKMSGNGNNISGFSALPGGYRNDDGSFYVIRDFAFFWSATVNNINDTWNRALNNHNSNVYKFNSFESLGASVRCLRDY